MADFLNAYAPNFPVSEDALLSGHRVMFIALLLSLVLHFAIMRAMPWLEAISVKKPVTIEAEFMLVPPPVPEAAPEPAKPEPKPKVATKAIKPVPPANVKPEKVAPEKIPQPIEKPAKPVQKPEAVPLPVMTAEKPEPAAKDDYTVEAPPQAPVAPREVIATAPAPANESPAPTKPTAKETAKDTEDAVWDNETAWNEYGKNLFQVVSGHKKYPMIAQKRGWEGKVKVVIRFSSEGKILGISVKKPGEHQVLDDEALAMVRKGLEDLPVPGSLRGKAFTLTIPVDFHLTE